MKTLMIMCLIISSYSFSQEIYTFKSGGKVFENRKKLSSEDIDNYFGHKPEIVKLYKDGMFKKGTGNLLITSGLTLGIIKFIINGTQPIQREPDYSVSNKRTSNLLFYVAGGLIITAIPIKMGFQNKIKKAIYLMNEEIKQQNQNTGLIFETNIIANTNGFGLKLTF